jgi:hypothetical protein
MSTNGEEVEHLDGARQRTPEQQDVNTFEKNSKLHEHLIFDDNNFANKYY